MRVQQYVLMVKMAGKQLPLHTFTVPLQNDAVALSGISTRRVTPGISLACVK